MEYDNSDYEIALVFAEEIVSNFLHRINYKWEPNRDNDIDPSRCDDIRELIPRICDGVLQICFCPVQRRWLVSESVNAVASALKRLLPQERSDWLFLYFCDYGRYHMLAEDVDENLDLCVLLGVLLPLCGYFIYSWQFDLIDDIIDALCCILVEILPRDAYDTALGLATYIALLPLDEDD